MRRCCGSGHGEFDVVGLLAAFLFYTKKDKCGKLLKEKIGQGGIYY